MISRKLGLAQKGDWMGPPTPRYPGNVDGPFCPLYSERPDLEAAWSAAMDDIENSDLMLEGRPVAQPKAE